jgi:hypothetical protein
MELVQATGTEALPRGRVKAEKKMADRWWRVGVRTKVETVGVHCPVLRDRATERTRDDNAQVGGPAQKRIDVSCTRVERWTRRMESHDP